MAESNSPLLDPQRGTSSGHGQNQARNLAGGEALLDVNYDLMLNKLHLWHTNWSGDTAIPDAQNSWIGSDTP